jgi:hypothetical protein
VRLQWEWIAVHQEVDAVTLTMNFSGIAIDFAEVAAGAVEKQGAARLTPLEARMLLRVYQDFRQAIAEANAMWIKYLSEGIQVRPDPADAQTEETSRRLQPLGHRIRRMAKEARQHPIPDYAEKLVEEMEATAQEMLRSDELVKDYLAAVNAPPRPVDWDRIRQADEEFARGEFRRLS